MKQFRIFCRVVLFRRFLKILRFGSTSIKPVGINSLYDIAVKNFC